MRLSGKVAAVLGAGVLLGVVASTAPAFAASAYCQISDYSCRSESIQAGSSHQVGYTVSAAGGIRCYWVVRDVINGVAVGSGSTTTVTSGHIRGLYSRYDVELSSGGSRRAVGCYGVIGS